MSAPKIIVSYDGTNNEDDAIALGRVFAHAGAEVALAYVRHTQEPEPEREVLAEREAEALSSAAPRCLGRRASRATWSPTAPLPRGCAPWPSGRVRTRSYSARTPTPPPGT